MAHKPVGQPCSCGERGWMPGVEHVPILWAMAAANKATTMQPVLIVDHIMQGYLTTMVEWTRTGGSKVVVHFGIARNGRTVQMHPVFSPGIHATARAVNARTAKIVRARPESPNTYSIGIEHEGCSVDPRPAYEVPASLIYSRGNPWPEAMVQASIAVKRWCFANVPSLGGPSRDSIIGHYETGDPSRINDPAAEGARDVWPVDRMLVVLKGDRPTLAAAQREALEYADRIGATGQTRTDILAAVGLPPKARLEDYQPAGSTPPPAPKPPATAPAPPGAPSAPAVDVAGIRVHLDAATREIEAARRLLKEV